MKNLYLVKTNGFTELALHDTEEKTVAVLYTEEVYNPDFTLKDVEDMSAAQEIFEDVEDIEEFYGIDYNDGETPRIIETIENWEG